jgi:hypothetical protein
MMSPPRWFIQVALKADCAAPWRRCDYVGGAKRQGALEVGPSIHVVLLFAIEVNSDQALGNWYHFTKFIHRIKNLVTVK